VDDKGLNITQSLAKGNLLISCNGFYSKSFKRGSHGWIFATKQTSLWKGAGPMDGQPDLINPYRAELSDLVSILYILLSVS
jgi:hypothetical protein